MELSMMKNGLKSLGAQSCIYIVFISYVVRACLARQRTPRTSRRRASRGAGKKPSGSSPFYYVDVKVRYLGGGSLDGGDLASPRCLGPPGSTPEGCGAAHGPRHPAYPLLLRPVISF